MIINTDVIIIGAGPAGLSGAIYACRANLDVVVIESELPGGKLSKTHIIENYPGIESISGMDLADKLTNHAKSFGAKIIIATISKIEMRGQIKRVYLNNGDTYQGKAILLATGTKERQLEVENAEKYVGAGISYCAVCDGFFYRKKDVIVIGGGNSALQEALYLASIVNKVTIIIRRDQFRAEKKLVEKVMENEKIVVIYDSLPEELIIDNGRVIGLKIKNVKTEQSQIIPASGIFPYIGANPNNDLVDQSILNQQGYIITNLDMSTAITGVYGAGDCCQKGLRQVVTACNDGAIAANSIANLLK